MDSDGSYRLQPSRRRRICAQEMLLEHMATP
jgi:hypothetical protein